MRPRVSEADLTSWNVPPGLAAVALGLLVYGVTAYAFLAVSARALGPVRDAPVAASWAFVFLCGPGLFLPV